MSVERKACPLLVQSDTYPSLTMRGESHTRTFFLECLGEKCAAFTDGCRCARFGASVVETATAADVVEVVRCRDCAHHDECRAQNTWAVPPDDDWYCADGKRRA